MPEKKFGFVLSVLAAIGALSFSFASNKIDYVVNADEPETVQAEFASISWNNMDYSYTTGSSWCGDVGPSGAPENGYCLLVFFNEVGKSVQESKIGELTTSGRGVIGQGHNADTKIKVNGVNIVDVEDSVCYIYPQYGLFFYIPEASIIYSDTYKIPTISMEAGVSFNNVVLPEIHFEFQGEIGETNCWIYRKHSSEYNRFAFDCVAEGWNNAPVDATHAQNVLKFGEYGVDFLKKDGIASDHNLIGKYSDCGTKISVNGVPLWQIEDAVVNYAHGYCYLYISLPLSCMSPKNGYKVPTLHINEGTLFYDTVLPEVNLYLFMDRWIYTKPETPDDSDYVSSLTFSSIFGNEQVTLNEANRQISSEKECSIYDFGFYFDYKLENSDSSFVLYAAGAKNQTGLRLVFRGKTISVYDATENYSLLGSIDLLNFSFNEWYSLFIYTKTVDDELSLCVAIDEITYIHLDSPNIVNQDNLGNLFSIVLGTGTVSLKNTVLGGDNKKPTLTYNGKLVYGVLSGSEQIDFASKCAAFDAHDGDVTNLIQCVWPEGSLTDGKINKGIWEVKISAFDKSGNTDQMIVTVVVADKLEVKVTFDGANETIYQIGDHIVPIQNPHKEDTQTITYRFLGWYLNDRPWDFENDYVVEDINLVSRFIESVREYRLFMNVEGLPGVKTQSMYFTYGTVVNMSIFEKEGYSLKAYLNEEEVTSITITADTTLKLVYASTNPEQGKNGCGGSVAASGILLSILSLAGIAIAFGRRKGGKEHE